MHYMQPVSCICMYIWWRIRASSSNNKNLSVHELNFTKGTNKYNPQILCLFKMLLLHNGVLLSTMVPVSFHCSIKTAYSRPQEQHRIFYSLYSQLSGSTSTSICCWNWIYSVCISILPNMYVRYSWKRIRSLKEMWCMWYLISYSGIHNLDAHESRGGATWSAVVAGATPYRG